MPLFLSLASCSSGKQIGETRFLLQRQHAPGGSSLHPGDDLYIVHVHGAKQGAGKKPSWQAGGALMHSLQVRTPYVIPQESCMLDGLHACLAMRQLENSAFELLNASNDLTPAAGTEWDSLLDAGLAGAVPAHDRGADGL